MKKCSRCAQIATLHITEINKGETEELHLCEACAKNYLEQTPPQELDDEELALQELAHIPELDEEEDDLLSEIVCPSCGITYQEFRSKGRLGCPQDYIVFETQLMGLLENIHGETEHRGKLPKRAPGASQKQYEVIRLRNDLNEAVEEENYEKAAELRDAITALEQDLSSNESSEES